MSIRHGKTAIALAIAALVVLCDGCAQSKSAENPAAMTPAQARAAVGDIAIGHQLSADGMIAGDQKGNNFTAGQPVVVAVAIGQAPVGTPVTIGWYGPAGQQLATDQRTVTRGNQSVSFAAKDTAAWSKGDYHADISVGGQKVDTERFSIAPAETAENTSATQTAGKAIGDVTVGHKLGAAGSIANGQQGKNFQAGQPVYIALATGDATPGTKVEVDWYGPNDQKLASDQKQVASGDTVLHFAALQTAGWSLGDYRADLLVDGQKVDTEHFSIVNAGQADQTSGGR